MVRLVIDDEDVLHAHQVGHHALEHLAFGLLRIQFLANASLKQRAAAGRKFDALPQLEGMVVGDDDLGPVHVVEHVAGNQFTAGVVTVGIVGLEDTQPVLDGQAGYADQKAAGEMLAPWASHRIDRLPSDEHGHDGGLACARGQFQREPHQFRVGVLVRGGEMINYTLAPARLRSDLSEPDRGFRCLHLAEERTDPAEFVMAPMLEEPGRLRRDLPLIGVGQGTPGIHISADFIDDGSGVVLLFLGRKPLAFVEDKPGLRGRLALFRLRDRRDELGTATELDDLLRGLAGLIEFPMPPRVLVGGV